jgi:hypothetical protein
VQWLIEWTYTPTGFFEEPLQVQHEHYELTIKEGKAIAKINPACGDPRPTLRDQLDAELNSRFIGAQLVSGKPFKVSLSSIHNEKPGGGKNIFVEVSELIGVFDIQADIRIVGKDGNVIADNRAERIKRTHSLADLAAKCARTDEVAKKILQSYKNAIDDPDDLLVHLYEIRDALQMHFGGRKKAKEALKLTEAQWDCLGRLSSAEPLKQGRHRGQHLSGLRDATKQELDAAMTAAQTMIENYLRSVDGTL